MLTCAIIILILILILLAGFFAGAETAVTSADKILIAQRAEDGCTHAIKAKRIISHMELMLATTLVGTNIGIASSTTLARDLMVDFFPKHWIDPVNTLIMAPLVMIIGDLIPKSLGRSHPNEFTQRVSSPLLISEKLFLPIIWITGKIASTIAGLFGKTAAGAAAVTRDDVCTIAEMAAEEGLLAGESGKMLKTVFELNNKPVSAAMVPFVDVSMISSDSMLSDLEKLAVETGFTRFPVYRGKLYDVIGIVDMRKLLFKIGETDSSHELPIAGFIEEKIVFVPETKPVGDLLHEMRFQHIPMAMVVDEHGGVCGLVTTEDLIEEVVGEIHDERDKTPSHITKIKTGEFECDGKIEIRHLEEALGIDIEEEGFDTAAGLALKILGKIPAPGESIKYKQYRIEILEVKKRHIKRLRFKRMKKGWNPPILRQQDCHLCPQCGSADLKAVIDGKESLFRADNKGRLFINGTPVKSPSLFNLKKIGCQSCSWQGPPFDLAAPAQTY